MFCRPFIYIDPVGEEALKTFKYKGGSDSYLYGLVWSPLTEFLVNKIFPPWLAPNVITLVGFLVVCLSASILQYYSWDYRTELPSWTLYFATFSILIYQILDNADGKQARKTGSSSPLGMLFDHGCDTSASWIIGMMLANALQLGNSYTFFFGVMAIAFIGFFFGMWSQYHIGYLRLASINAVDEGLVLIELVFLISAIFGQGLWSFMVPGIHIYLSQLFVLVMAVVATFQDFNFFYSVLKVKSFNATISSLGLPFTISIVFFITATQSPTQIIKTSGHLYIYAFGLMWSKMVGHLQLAHVVNQKFDQWKLTWILICAAQIINIYSSFWNNGRCIIEEITFAYLLIAFAFIFYMHFSIFVSLHIAKILDIRIFKLKNKKKQYEELSSQNQEKQLDDKDIELKIHI